MEEIEIEKLFYKILGRILLDHYYDDVHLCRDVVVAIKYRHGTVAIVTVYCHNI